MVYLAIAYRYGDINGHWYVVSADTDKEKVLALAELEPHDRGGKYGVAVTCHKPNGDTENVAYFPSSIGEAKPKVCRMTWADKNIGARVRMDIDTLTLDEIKAIVKRELEIGEIFEKAGL